MCALVRVANPQSHSLAFGSTPHPPVVEWKVWLTQAGSMGMSLTRAWSALHPNLRELVEPIWDPETGSLAPHGRALLTTAAGLTEPIFVLRREPSVVTGEPEATLVGPFRWIPSPDPQNHQAWPGPDAPPGRRPEGDGEQQIRPPMRGWTVADLDAASHLHEGPRLWPTNPQLCMVLAPSRHHTHPRVADGSGQFKWPHDIVCSPARVTALTNLCRVCVLRRRPLCLIFMEHMARKHAQIRDDERRHDERLGKFGTLDVLWAVTSRLRQSLMDDEGTFRVRKPLQMWWTIPHQAVCPILVAISILRKMVNQHGYTSMSLFAPKTCKRYCRPVGFDSR